jgi:hypothetical protein
MLVAVVVEHITVELLALEVLEAVVVVEQVVLTITELLELPIRAVAVAVALFKQTFLTWLAVLAVLVWLFCLFHQQIILALQQVLQQLQQVGQTQF